MYCNIDSREENKRQLQRWSGPGPDSGSTKGVNVSCIRQFWTYKHLSQIWRLFARITIPPFEISEHGAHLVPLPRPVVALERRAAIRIHQHTPYSPSARVSRQGSGTRPPPESKC
jgi:hypothetical protein